MTLSNIWGWVYSCVLLLLPEHQNPSLMEIQMLRGSATWLSYQITF